MPQSRVVGRWDLSKTGCYSGLWGTLDPGVTHAGDQPPNRSAALETESKAAEQTKQRGRHT